MPSVTERPQDEVGRRERGRVTASEVSWAARALQRAQVELDRALAARLHLRALDYAAMSHMLGAESPLGPVELASRLGISSGSGTELADRLERAGHLHRRRAADDRRRVVLEPDEASVARMLGELAPLFRELDALAGSFSPDEQAVIARYLSAAADHVRAHADTLAGLA
jgi:MarR family transcriptional regulator, organic hydroperoxide resistance regulator